MIVEIVANVIVPAIVSFGAWRIVRRAKKQEVPATSYVEDWAMRPIFPEAEFEKMRHIIVVHDEVGKKASNAAFPRELIRQVILQGYRFTANQISILCDEMKRWRFFDGKEDEARVLRMTRDTTHYDTTIKVEAEEMISRLMSGI
jgi:hypothetical protein